MKGLVEEVRLLDDLHEHAGWKRLYERIRADRERFLYRLASRIMAGDLVDQREVDFHRGYYRGALDTVERPEKALADLEKAARFAYTQAQLEVYSEQENETPYV